MTDDVSVVMTVAGEPVERLARSLAAIAAQQRCTPVEVVVATPDRASVDEAVRQVRPVFAVRVVPNPSGRRTPGLNAAIRAARGDFVCRVDARSVVPPEYVRRCVDRLVSDERIGVVGGFQRPVSLQKGAVAAGVARALRNPYALGAPAYRRAGGGGAADTVYLGAWRRAELVDVGGFDERLDANEDFELCRRFRDRGAIVWLEPGLDVPYEARSTLLDVTRQYYAFGRSKVRYWRETGTRPNARQTGALAIAVCGVLATSAVVRRPRRVAGVAAVGLAGLLALDHLADPGHGSPSERLAAAVASGCVMAAWVSGVARELAASA
jgi:GT2 family glycosyltransferase